MEETTASGAVISAALSLLRGHLGLDVAFVSQLTEDGLRVFRHVDADNLDLIAPGDVDPAEESYCHHVARGDVPQFLADPRTHPITSRLRVTRALPVGTHYSVPLVLSDGSVFGTFCGFSHTVDPRRDDRDLDAVRVLAAIVARHVEQDEMARRRSRWDRAHLLAQQPGAGLLLVAQPIVHMASGDVAGHELLARFPAIGEPPDIVFAEAWRLGVGVELELRTLQFAQETSADMPQRHRISVNLAPATLVAAGFFDVLDVRHASRLVVEITEHATVRDYDQLRVVIDRLKRLGVRIAVDDVGTGVSGLDHILRLQPDILKIDGALVRDVDRSTNKQAMIAALVAFSSRVGMGLVAEQVETEGELQALVDLGVGYAQGYLLGRPNPLSATVQLQTQHGW